MTLLHYLFILLTRKCYLSFMVVYVSTTNIKHYSSQFYSYIEVFFLHLAMPSVVQFFISLARFRLNGIALDWDVLLIETKYDQIVGYLLFRDLRNARVFGDVWNLLSGFSWRYINDLCKCMFGAFTLWVLFFRRRERLKYEQTKWSIWWKELHYVRM